MKTSILVKTKLNGDLFLCFNCFNQFFKNGNNRNFTPLVIKNCIHRKTELFQIYYLSKIK